MYGLFLLQWEESIYFHTMHRQLPLFLVLHNVRSAYNVGAIFRTADGAGVAHIHLSGYTPTPPDGSRPFTTKPERMVIKTALGAQETVPWSHRDTFEEVIALLRADGVHIVALEQTPQSVDYRAYQPTGPTALVLGNEPDGIDMAHLALCDAAMDIPMYGTKTSLNVSVAAGIALYALRFSL